MDKRKKEGEVKAGDLMFLWAWRDETFHGDPATSTPSPPLLVTSCSSAFHSLPAFSLVCDSPLTFSGPVSIGPSSHSPTSLSSIKSKFQSSRQSHSPSSGATWRYLVHSILPHSAGSQSRMFRSTKCGYRTNHISEISVLYCQILSRCWS